MEDYFIMPYRELQAELKKRGLKASGKKDDLIARLEKSDEEGYVDDTKDEKIRKEEEQNRGTILFHVKTLVGSWYDLRINEDQTIFDLKKKIEEKTGIEPEQMRLTLRSGQNIDDDVKASDFGYDDVFLDMMVRLRTIVRKK